MAARKRRKRGRWGNYLSQRRKARQRNAVYSCVHFPLLFIAKVGITNNKGRRMSEINESIPGFLIPIVWPRVRNARALERWIHNRGAWVRFRFTGSGKTEYFLSAILLLSIPVTVVVWLWQRLILPFILAVLFLWIAAGCPTFNLL